jgi:predicted RNA-binding Zn-ribbon protein involved in translation (DUF1610 family)
MPIKFSCPECGESVVLRFLRSGEIAQCRACGAEVPVPDDAEETDEPKSFLERRLDETRPVEPSAAAGPERYPAFRLLSPILLVLAVITAVWTVLTIGYLLSLRADAWFIICILISGSVYTLVLIGLSQGARVLLEILEHVRPSVRSTPPPRPC